MQKTKNISDEDIVAGLSGFSGVGRRFEMTTDVAIGDKSIMFVDDYGHHPQEVKATLLALKEGWPGKRVVMLFQPHRYTRTQDLYDDFVSVLSQVDCLIMLEVYAAGEEKIPGADAKSLCSSIRKRGKVDPVLVTDNDSIPELLKTLVQDGDVLLIQGAGNIGKISGHLLESNFQSVD